MKQLRIMVIFCSVFLVSRLCASEADTQREAEGHPLRPLTVHATTASPAFAESIAAPPPAITLGISADLAQDAIARKIGPAGAMVLALLLLISHAHLRLRRETRRREHSEAQLADVTRNMPAVVYRFHYYPDGRVRFVYVGGNPEPIFDVPAETFLQDERRAFARIDGRDQATLMAEVARAATSLTPIHAEMRIRDATPERWVASHAVPRRLHGAVEFTGYWIDISEQRLQSAQLAAARDAAELATRAKSRFLATMGHEIRTPMHGIIGMLEMLGGTSLDPTQRRLLGTAETSAEALLQILDDVLDFSRIEAGRLVVERTPVDVRKLVSAVADLFAWQASQKRLSLECRIDVHLAAWVLTDGARLRQVLLNVVSNAIKFTMQGAVVLTVEVAGDVDGRQQLRFTITDTGIGIADDDMSRLFEPFTQAEASTPRRFGGSGLGLVISRRLIALLGGHIRMTSEPGVGTQVTIDLELPVVRSQEPAFPRIAEPVVDRAGVSLDVLVAEDNPTNQELIAAQLERLGHRHTIVDNGDLALQAAASHSFDVLLTDLQMPGRDGHALARALRKQGACLPIIAMTAHAMPAEQQRCVASGMDGCLTKPVRLDALRERLTAVVAGDGVWDLDALRDDLGSLNALPAMVARFVATTQVDIAGAARLTTADEAAAWSHRVSGGLRVFGRSHAATILEAFERELRGECGEMAMQRLEGVVAALDIHVNRMTEAARDIPKD